jgi:hypothetical protein
MLKKRLVKKLEQKKKHGQNTSNPNQEESEGMI